MSVTTTTLVKKDFVEVGFGSINDSDGSDSDNESSYYDNNNSSIKIYYEIHGSGPNKILFIMGRWSVSWFSLIKRFIIDLLLTTQVNRTKYNIGCLGESGIMNFIVCYYHYKSTFLD